MCSLMCVPGILVLMGLNSPRMLAGASGFGSQMSMWLGPPCRNTMITDFALAEAARPRRTCRPHWPALPATPGRNAARFNPSSPIEPVRSSSRRVGPSQVWH